jgi:hypothetical protein
MENRQKFRRHMQSKSMKWGHFLEHEVQTMVFPDRIARVNSGNIEISML